MTRHVYFGRDADGIFVKDAQSDHPTPATPVIDGEPVEDTMHLELFHRGEPVIVYWREAEIERAAMPALIEAYLQSLP